MSCSPSWEELLNGGVPKIRHIPEACERNTLSAFKCNMFHEASCSPALPGFFKFFCAIAPAISGPQCCQSNGRVSWSFLCKAAVHGIWHLALVSQSRWLRAIYCQLGLSLWVAASWGCGTGSWRELDSRNRALESGSHQIGLDQLTPANAPGVLEAYDAIIVDLQLVDEVPKVKVKCNVATPL